jgi:DnaJ-class molecular chaperone
MSKDLEMMKKGQTIHRQFADCPACKGKGERRESVSYYDVEWVTCYGCKGKGQYLTQDRIVCGEAPVTGAKNPFLPAKDLPQ